MTRLEWQAELRKNMCENLNNVLTYDFVVGFGKKKPFAVLFIIVTMCTYMLADLVRMFFDLDYPPQPEWSNVNGKITLLGDE